MSVLALKRDFAADRLKEDLLGQIEAGKLGVGDAVASERALASAYGLGYLTARKAIGELVAAGVLVRRQGRGTFVLRRPGSKSAGLTIRVILDDPSQVRGSGALGTWTGTAETLAGVQDACRECGYQMIVRFMTDCELDDLDGREPRIILARRRVALDAARLKDSGAPHVYVNPSLQSIPAHHVSCDDRYGLAVATDHMISLGYRRIAFVGQTQNDLGTLPRFAGFLAALRDHGLAADWVAADGTRTVDGAHREVKRLFAGPQAPDAIVAATDHMAIGAIMALREAGLRAGEDVGVIGFDDAEEAAHCDPPLSTMAKPRRRMGYEAVRFVEEWVARPGQAPVSRVMKPELVVRESCGANRLRRARGGGAIG